MIDSDQDFLRELVQQQSRASHSPGTTLRPPRVRAITSISDYCRHLQACEVAELPELEPLPPSRGRLAGASRNFFHEPEAFAYFAGELIPQWRETSPTATLGAWCIGCGHGQDAYSLAMLLAESGGDWLVEATERDERRLQAARIGIYSEINVLSVPPELLVQHFEEGLGPQDGRVRVRSALQERMTFRLLDLTERLEMMPGCFHAIFCRYQLSSYEPKLRAGLVQRLSRRLVPGGVLVLGAAERLELDACPLEFMQTAVYRRPL